MPACVERYRANFGMDYGHHGRWRQEKRFMRRSGMSDPVQQAFYLGEWLGGRFRASIGDAAPNRYPAGRRRDAFLSGFAMASEVVLDR
jgi:hypothetical protein